MLASLPMREYRTHDAIGFSVKTRVRCFFPVNLCWLHLLGENTLLMLLDSLSRPGCPVLAVTEHYFTVMCTAYSFHISIPN